MAQVQYNFKIEDELKQQAESLSKDFQSKQEFLQALLSSYQAAKANAGDTDIDISKYEDIDAKTKTLLSDAFKHIIYTLQQNSTGIKQELLSVEKEKQFIAEERAAFQTQIQKLQAKHNEELLLKEQEHKEQLSIKDEEIQKIKADIQDISDIKDNLDTKLKEKEKELKQVQSIADQSQSIAAENAELRAIIEEFKINYKKEQKEQEKEFKKLKDLLFEQEKAEYKKDLDIQNMQKDIKTLQNDISKYQEDIKEKDVEIKELEKQNTILATKLEMQKEK